MSFLKPTRTLGWRMPEKHQNLGVFQCNTFDFNNPYQHKSVAQIQPKHCSESENNGLGKNVNNIRITSGSQ